jgi:hypothetical protein
MSNLYYLYHLYIKNSSSSRRCAYVDGERQTGLATGNMAKDPVWMGHWIGVDKSAVVPKGCVGSEESTVVPQRISTHVYNISKMEHSRREEKNRRIHGLGQPVNPPSR